jgi:hypothetical protein
MVRGYNESALRKVLVLRKLKNLKKVKKGVDKKTSRAYN